MNKERSIGVLEYYVSDILDFDNHVLSFPLLRYSNTPITLWVSKEWR
jgi:hypothetical protein